MKCLIKKTHKVKYYFKYKNKYYGVGTKKCIKKLKEKIKNKDVNVKKVIVNKSQRSNLINLNKKKSKKKSEQKRKKIFHLKGGEYEFFDLKEFLSNNSDIKNSKYSPKKVDAGVDLVCEGNDEENSFINEYRKNNLLKKIVLAYLQGLLPSLPETFTLTDLEKDFDEKKSKYIKHISEEILYEENKDADRKKIRREYDTFKTSIILNIHTYLLDNNHNDKYYDKIKSSYSDNTVYIRYACEECKDIREMQTRKEIDETYNRMCFLCVKILIGNPDQQVKLYNFLHELEKIVIENKGTNVYIKSIKVNSQKTGFVVITKSGDKLEISLFEQEYNLYNKLDDEIKDHITVNQFDFIHLINLYLVVKDLFPDIINDIKQAKQIITMIIHFWEESEKISTDKDAFYEEMKKDDYKNFNFLLFSKKLLGINSTSTPKESIEKNHIYLDYRFCIKPKKGSERESKDGLRGITLKNAQDIDYFNYTTQSNEEFLYTIKKDKRHSHRENFFELLKLNLFNRLSIKDYKKE